MAALTLQINSLEALERLIGGDTEMEIDIRRSVVDAFADKYIKPVAVQKMDKIIADLIKPAKDELQKETDKYFTSTYEGSGWSGKTVFRLSEERRNIFIDHAKKLVADATDAAISQAIEEAKTVIDVRVSVAMKEVEAHIKWATSEKRFEYMVNEVSQKRIAGLLNKVDK